MGATTAGQQRRVSLIDLLDIARRGLVVRRLRTTLAALGIAIGIGSMVTVVGISASAGAELDTRLDRLGTNLLTASAGRNPFGEEVPLPKSATAMVNRIAAVEHVSATGQVPGVRVYRTNLMPSGRGGGISVLAADLDLPTTLGLEVGSGQWLNEATHRYPAVVLGAEAATTIGVASVDLPVLVLLGDEWFTMVGILDPAPLAPEIDNSALIGWPVAERLLGFNGHPTRLYERSSPDAVDDVRSLLPRTINPEEPAAVSVSRPSDALTAQLEARRAFTNLLLGIGAVALLVGAIGVTNTMVISVLERRAEIGLRRALGATKRLIFAQFVVEALVLAGAGGVAGAALGTLATISYVITRGWTLVLPVHALVAAAVGSAIVGAAAGALPAGKAARMAPADALGVN